MTAPVHAFLAAAALCAAHALQIAWAATPAPHCASLPPTLARTLQPGALLLLGELHGSVQSPAMAARIVCGALRHDRQVVLFLEIPHDEQPRLDAYLRSVGDAEARRALVRGSNFWEAPPEGQDGRCSLAIFDLIDAVRRLRQQSAALTLIAFDVDGADAADRDRTMADRVRTERARDPTALLIAYTGNIHNMPALPPGLAGGIPAPMATHLRDLRAVALDLRAEEGGTAWNCRESCVVHATAPTPAAVRRALSEERPMPYTAVWPLGPVTASLPAVYRLDAGVAR